MAYSRNNQFSESTVRVLSILAWASILALIVLTVVPANERPTTPAPHNIEHLAAFAIAGTFVGLSFRQQPRVLFVAAIAFAACLEAIQLKLPTRHARLADFLENSLGSWIGLTIGYLILTMRRRSN